MTRFARNNYRAIVAALGAVVALSATTGMSVLADVHWH